RRAGRVQPRPGERQVPGGLRAHAGRDRGAEPQAAHHPGRWRLHLGQGADGRDGRDRRAAGRGPRQARGRRHPDRRALRAGARRAGAGGALTAPTTRPPGGSHHDRMAIRIGISGWRYAPWRGVFYPDGLPQRCELEYAARRFGSIEVNGSFYSLQSPTSWQSWRDATPEGFVFAVKGPRYLTHMRRLRDFERPLANFLASGLLRLGDRLGPLLWQLPPNFAFDAARLDAFLAALPRDTGEALALARRRDVALMRGRSALAIDAVRPLRHALEPRHESFASREALALLRRHGVALVVADSAGKFPRFEQRTAGF